MLHIRDRLYLIPLGDFYFFYDGALYDVKHLPPDGPPADRSHALAQLVLEKVDEGGADELIFRVKIEISRCSIDRQSRSGLIGVRGMLTDTITQ